MGLLIACAVALVAHRAKAGCCAQLLEGIGILAGLFHGSEKFGLEHLEYRHLMQH